MGLTVFTFVPNLVTIASAAIFIVQQDSTITIRDSLLGVPLDARRRFFPFSVTLHIAEILSWQVVSALRSGCVAIAIGHIMTRPIYDRHVKARVQIVPLVQ